MIQEIKSQESVLFKMSLADIIVHLLTINAEYQRL